MTTRNWRTNLMTINTPLPYSIIIRCRQEKLGVSGGESNSVNSILMSLYDITIPSLNIPQTNRVVTRSRGNHGVVC